MKIKLSILFISLGILAHGQGQQVEVELACSNDESNIYGARLVGENIYIVSDQPGDKIQERDSQTGLPFTSVFLLDECTLKPAELLNAKYNKILPISSLKHDGPVSSNPQGDILFFSNNSDGKLVTQMGIFYLKKMDNGWSESISFPFNSPTYSCLHPFFDEQNGRILFSSDMPGGNGKFDLYEVPFDGTTFGQIRNLSELNSEENDLFPAVWNNRIYFTSDRKTGLGKMDVLMWDTDEITHFGYPINTEYDDFAYFPVHEGSGFVSSNRNTSGQRDELYLVRVKTNLITPDGENITNDLFVSENLHSTSDFLKEKIHQQSNEGSVSSLIQQVASSSLNSVDNLTTNLQLKSTEINSTWSTFEDELNNLLFNGDLSGIRKKIELEEEIKALIQDVHASKNVNEKDSLIELIQKRLQEYDPVLAEKFEPKLAALKSDYYTFSEKLTELEEENEKLKDLALIALRIEAAEQNSSLEEFARNNPEKLMRIGISQTEFNSKNIGKNTLIALAESREPIIVYFEFDSYSVRREYVPELLTLIQTVQFLEGIKIHIEGHTDNTGSSAYNLILSKRRALSVKKQLSAQGMDLNKFESRYFGFNRPRKENNTKKGRAENRRVEILLVVD